MGLLKKIGLGLLLLLTVVGVMFHWYYAYYHTENLQISAEASSKPAGELSSLPLEDEVMLYPSSMVIEIDVRVRNLNPSDIRVDEAGYVISLEGEEVQRGEVRDALLPSRSTTSLPTIRVPLSMGEVARLEPLLMERIAENRGRANLEISVSLETPALFLGVIRIGTAETSEDLRVDVNLVDVFTVSNFNWERDGGLADECHPGDDVVGEFRIAKTGETSEDMWAEIIEHSTDGRQRVVDLIEVEGTPTRWHESFHLSWNVPDSPPMDSAGYSIRLLYGGIEVWPSTQEAPSIRLVRRYTLHEALAMEGQLEVVLRGRGYCAGDTVRLEVKAELEATVELEIEPGTVLINSGSGQNMILAESSTVRLEPGVEVSLTLEAYCLDLHRDNPSSTEVFGVETGPGGYAEEAVALMRSLGDAPWERRSISGIQLALWVVVGNPTRGEVEEVFYVSEDNSEDAAWLLESIGIDPAQKRLFMEAGE